MKTNINSPEVASWEKHVSKFDRLQYLQPVPPMLQTALIVFMNLAVDIQNSGKATAELIYAGAINSVKLYVHDKGWYPLVPAEYIICFSDSNPEYVVETTITFINILHERGYINEHARDVAIETIQTTVEI